MFAKAYQIASEFTRPVIISLRFFDGTTDCVIGACVVLNEEGWIVTAAHILESLMISQKHREKINEFNQQVEQTESGRPIKSRHKRRREPRRTPNPKWITNHSYWWGQDGAQISEFAYNPSTDLAIGRLEPFQPDSISQYPVLKDPSNLQSGTSLCKLGFPFYAAKTSFDETTKRFILSPGTLPAPRFPIEGIYTRNILHSETPDSQPELRYIETSSPGLRGQSGGPVFDVNGVVWGIQSRTKHLALGFNPRIIQHGKEFEEHQFLNVGWAVHPKVLLDFLQVRGVKFKLSDY